MQNLPPKERACVLLKDVRLPHGEKTLLDALRFIVWHEGLQLGQVSLLRSRHGLAPLGHAGVGARGSGVTAAQDEEIAQRAYAQIPRTNSNCVSMS